ncbi:hypothetical protein RRG08_023219 [Elysia crispata]|uniref:Uncharacterized protein n=1 Tax=Elysia crispata TaxID=231223 RepID=A0AAE0ZQ06_9GAST|nr:hypothetical protein RRG08_023219 [Elysia crispata]
MTIRWQCAGSPHCRKTFLYARGLKAHMPTCKYAQSKKVKERRDELQTMLDIVMFVEDDQRGNITFSRHGQQRFQMGYPKLF